MTKIYLMISYVATGIDSSLLKVKYAALFLQFLIKDSMLSVQMH